MENNRLLRKTNSNELETDQEAAMTSYLTTGGRVCVDAGAGSGKTTVLIETLSETLLREIENNHQNSNPLGRMLVITFGVEASRHLKTKLKERLRDHQEAGGTLPDAIWRFIESESHIQTIDAFMQSLLRKIITEIGLNPSFEVPIALDQDQIVDEIINRLSDDPKIKSKWERLNKAYPTLDYLDRPPEELPTMIWQTHQKMREFCLDPATVKSDLIDAVKNIIHSGKEPSFTLNDLQEIIHDLSDGRYKLRCLTNQEETFVKYAEETFAYNIQLATDFGDILISFDKEYDKVTKEKGTLTHVDIAYHVWHYTMKEANKQWKESLQNKFDHILVDEFQDTNFVQYRVINSLIRDGPSELRNRIMFIGDIKQSIYQWRSAEPQIFSDLILALKKKRDNIPYPEGMEHKPLVSNFRSHKNLIDFFNAFAIDLFKDKARGAVSGEIPYEKLKAKMKAEENRSAPSIHVLTNPANSVADWINIEAEQIAGTINGILQNDSRILVRDGNSKEMRPPQAGDIVLLFRRKIYIETYVQALRAYGISCAIQTDSSLFSEPEVSLVIDFLDWLANPESRDSTTRILRSPIVALSDKTLRYLSQQKFYLQTALDNWNASLHLLEDDKTRLINILQFREDLRWDREGPKSSLIERIIDHGCLDCVVLSSKNGLQSQANLWMLIEVVSSWEEEKLLAYREFVERLKALRERANIDKDFPKAVLSDEKNVDSVRIMTIHAAKGLEFPIVIIPDIVHTDTKHQDRMIRNRTAGIILQPKAVRSMPQGVSIVNINSKKAVNWSGQGREDAILWLSPERRSDGTLSPESKLNQIIFESVAEFWRLFYVVATRARDHLIFSVGNHKTWNKYEWNSWMRFLRKKLELTHHKENSGPSFKKLKASDIEFKIGIDDLPKANKLNHSRLTPVIPNGKNKEYESGLPSYLPVSINPSTFPTLVECPRRYQYEYIWLVSSLRERFLNSGNRATVRPPYSRRGRRISADEWGNEVHEAFRQWDFSLELLSDPLLTDFISRFGDSARAEFEKALTNFSALASGKMAIKAALNGRKLEKEIDLDAMLNIRPDMPPIMVEGRVDLLFLNEKNEWILVDFKTEDMPPTDSYRSRIHQGQLNAYAWLIAKSMGRHVKKAYLAYVHPFPLEQEMIPNENWLEETGKVELTSLTLDSERGLKAKPSKELNGPCASCPYSKQVRGLCEN